MCVAEYLPSGVSAEFWYDSSGNGHHLPVFGEVIVSDLRPSIDRITEGKAAPDSAPTFVGQEYSDRNSRNIYKAVGTDTAADWLLIS